MPRTIGHPRDASFANFMTRTLQPGPLDWDGVALNVHLVSRADLTQEQREHLFFLVDPDLFEIEISLGLRAEH